MDQQEPGFVKFEEEDLVRMNRVLRHRLGNFVSGVKTSISLLSDELRDVVPPDVAEYFPLIASECVQIEDLTRRMTLVFDCVPAGGVVTVKHVLEKVCSDCRTSFPAADIRVKADHVALELKVAHDSLVSSALLEIVKNAYEASPRSSITLKFHVEDRFAVVTVIDVGPGIQEDDRNKIFLPFYTTKSKHVGIGLTIARRLLTLAGGSVSLKDGVKTGFALEVMVPICA